jgi:alkanesulfonate monooxygenase SsuD/methylene tetrahydromethanopterin reductase-like flavin-dependent oxidoreductase (luciferase family)
MVESPLRLRLDGTPTILFFRPIPEPPRRHVREDRPRPETVARRKVSLPNGTGVSTEVNILPAPIQRELPIWLTGQSDDTFSKAGKLGFNVLTANFALHHDLKGFVRKLKLYRDTIQAHHGHRGHISLMAHAFVGDSGDAIKKIAQPAMAEYIKVEMQKDHSAGTRDEQGALRKTSWVNPTISVLSEKDTQAIIDAQVHNNFRGPLSLSGRSRNVRSKPSV